MAKILRRLLLLVILAAVTVWTVRQARVKTVSDPNVIRVSGTVEVTDAELSFRLGGQVAERLVGEGELVRAGQVVARLDRTDLALELTLRQAELRAAQALVAELEAGARPAELAQAQAAIARAQAQLADLLAGPRPEDIAVAAAAVNGARITVAYLAGELARQTQLFNDHIIAQWEFDRAKSEHDRAVARQQEAEAQLKLAQTGARADQVAQARAAVREAEQRLALLKEGARAETIEQARARVAQAQVAIALAETRLGYATLIAPRAGLVLAEPIEPGEFVAPGTPVVTVGDLEQVWLRAYIHERDLGRVTVGQAVRLTTDTYPGKVYAGRISFIAASAEFTPKNVQTQKERVKLVYRVKVVLSNPDLELKPGMPADAVIVTGPGAR